MCLQFIPIGKIERAECSFLLEVDQNAQSMLVHRYCLRNDVHGLSAAFYSRPCADGREIAEVIKIIEDLEALFVHARSEQIGRKTGTAADHLQELDLGSHLLEEHQIDHVRNINTGVHHINADGDLRHTAAHLELFDQCQVALYMAVDQLAEIHAKLGIDLLEALNDFDCFDMAGCKNDGLAQRIAAVNLQTVLHQIAQHGINSAEVEDISTNMLSFDLCAGEVDVFFIRISKAVLKGLLFFFSQIIIFDAAAHLIRGLIQYGEAHKIFILNGFFQFIGKVGLAVLQLEGIISALVFLAARGRSQADHQRIEIVEQRAIFFKDGAVRFIDDDQIESAHAKLAGIVIDQIDHGLIGRKDDACVGVPVKAAAGIQ